MKKEKKFTWTNRDISTILPIKMIIIIIKNNPNNNNNYSLMKSRMKYNPSIKYSTVSIKQSIIATPIASQKVR